MSLLVSYILSNLIRIPHSWCILYFHFECSLLSSYKVSQHHLFKPTYLVSCCGNKWVNFVQWFSMRRQHALIVIADSLYYSRFRDYCKVNLILNCSLIDSNLLCFEFQQLPLIYGWGSWWIFYSSFPKVILKSSLPTLVCHKPYVPFEVNQWTWKVYFISIFLIYPFIPLTLLPLSNSVKICFNIVK